MTAERHRARTMSLDDFAASIVNSLSDTMAMVIGFLLVRAIPKTAVVALALAFHVLARAAHARQSGAQRAHADSCLRDDPATPARRSSDTPKKRLALAAVQS
jgi:Protein of unknown function (DUF2585)